MFLNFSFSSMMSGLVGWEVRQRPGLLTLWQTAFERRRVRVGIRTGPHGIANKYLHDDVFDLPQYSGRERWGKAPRHSAAIRTRTRMTTGLPSS